MVFMNVMELYNYTLHVMNVIKVSTVTSEYVTTKTTKLFFHDFIQLHSMWG